jgi:hypothetical protein
LRRHEDTITELRKRLDEMETMVLHLTTWGWDRGHEQ